MKCLIAAFWLLFAVTTWGQEKAGPATQVTVDDFFTKVIEGAAQGAANSQFLLGYMYSLGRGGVPQDYAEAVKWYRKAAEQGDAEAQSSLGFMYYQGQGVPQDYAEAVKWYRRAAEQEEANAQTLLGLMYFSGQGVVQDYVQAHMWVNLGASRASGPEQKYSAELRDEVAAKMTPAQIAEAQRLARGWKPKPQAQPPESK